MPCSTGCARRRSLPVRSIPTDARTTVRDEAGPRPEPASSGLREVVAVMAKLGVIGFGGPAAHLALMRDEAVVKRAWVSEQEFLDLVGAASALPGPTSTQVSMLLGKRRAGWAGLIVGGSCFILPAMLIVLGLAVAYEHWGTTVGATGVLYGIKPVVIAIVAQAVWSLSRTAVHGRVLLATCGFATGAVYLAGGNVLFALVGVAVFVMLVDNRRRLASGLPAFLPVAVLPAAVVGSGARVRPSPRLLELLFEFLKLGFVVFGSGYVLLAFLRRDLVTDYHWISTRQLLDAVAVGQFTPGPVFTTATFVGYLVGGFGGALVATLGIFVPSFVMMTLLAPLVPRLRRLPWTSSALDGLNAAAVGLMVGVGIDLGRSAIVDPLTGALAAAALAVLVRGKANTVTVLAAGAIIGLVHALV